jgi:hypothetical protein
VYVGLQNSVDLGETVRLVCSERTLAVTAGGIDVCDMKVEELLEPKKEQDPLALPAIKAENEVLIGRLSVFCCF